MPFGLTGAPRTFLSAMNATLGPYLRKFVLIFFDDILIYSKTYEDHLINVFAHLGHVISAQGVATDPAKQRNYGVFLGLLVIIANIYVIFALWPNHSMIYSRKEQCLYGHRIGSSGLLQTLFETDASGSGIGAVLMQDGHPLAFISKPLGPRSLGLLTYEKEYMAILFTVEQWRAYLQHGEFIVFTDQKSLVQLTDQRLHTHWQRKVFSKLLGLQYKVVYKKGSDNRVADALSRYPVATTQCAAISKVCLSGFKRCWTAMLAVPPALRLKLIQAFHSSAVGGHSGIPVTYGRMKKLFAWSGMKKEVITFVQSCLTCQPSKPDRQCLPGSLQPLPVPTQAWQIVSLDFIEGLPLSGHANCILVVVDSFTKYGHFILLHHPFTAVTVAKAFLHNVYRLHGMPEQLVSDRDRIFTSTLWKELFRLADVKLAMSTSYHPQSDGQTEHLNQTLETFLRCFVNACPAKWSHWPSLVEYWYNTNPNSATGKAVTASPNLGRQQNGGASVGAVVKLASFYGDLGR
ncbi:hypothetical protein U9M48_026871 [Paspalum notatum var. saurae]|uniref:Integrase catalytic domain-containing protein n=1 Tax=Paspalum notatum var. saurae TaxID=547442 RepID=A0AAQ3WZB9_PASNO